MFIIFPLFERPIFPGQVTHSSAAQRGISYGGGGAQSPTG